jgi:hypothetical protein
VYIVIGGDGQRYGPVSVEQVRQWITEGRLNSQSLAQPVGSTDWKRLMDFPEFAANLGGTVVPPPQFGGMYVPAINLKSKIAAGLLGIFLGGLGVHRFYLGYIGVGIAQIVVTFVTCGVGQLWGFIEGILILCGTTITTDSQGRPLKD